MSRFVAILQPGSELMFVTPDNIEGNADARVWATTWGHVGVQRPHSHGDHADLNGLPCHLES